MTGYDFSIQFSSVPFVPCTFPPLCFSLFPSFSVTCNSREDENGVDPPQLSPARRKERRERRGREAVRWFEEGGRKGKGGGVRRRNGIHFEIASHPVRSPFSTAYPPYPDTLPQPFPGSFPQEKPLPLLDSYRPSRSLSLWLAPFRETACSPRILISSKVLFPLNRAATRNNALYVRVLRLSLPPSLRRLFLSRSGHSTFLRVLLVLVVRLSSCRRARNVPKFVLKQFYIFN